MTVELVALVVVSLIAIAFILLFSRARRDLHGLSTQLTEVERALAGEIFKPTSQPFFKVARYASMRLLALSHRMVFLTQHEEDGAEGKEAFLAQIDRVMSKVEVNDPLPHLVAGALEALKERFLARTLAFLVIRDATHQDAELFIEGSRVQAVEEVLLRELTSLLRDATSPAEGKIPLENPVLHAYGFAAAIQFQVPLRLPNGSAKAVLWFGYGKQTPPSLIEERRAKAYARALSFHLSSRFALARLREEAATEWGSDGERSEHLTHISHDIKAPLNNIKAILHLLELQAYDSDSHELVSTALNNCGRLHGLVNDVIDFSKHKAGELQAKDDLFDLREIATEVVNSFRVTARMEEKNLLLIESPPAMVKADRSHVARIVTNLVSNALKYSQQRARIQIKIESSSTENATVTVEDNGIGMNADQVARLFTPFTRFSSTKEGAGLGLSLSRVLAEKSGGSLTVTSEPGKGSTFTLTLPSAATTQVTDENASSLILLVDDDEDCLFSLGRLLSREGYEILTASSIHEAKLALTQHQVIAIVADFNLQDGTAADLFCNPLPQRNAPAIVLLTGHDRAPELTTDYHYTYLQKPVEPDKLYEAVRPKV